MKLAFLPEAREEFGEAVAYLRVEYPGAIYHVMSRGDRREDII